MIISKSHELRLPIGQRLRQDVFRIDVRNQPDRRSTNSSHGLLTEWYFFFLERESRAVEAKLTTVIWLLTEKALVLFPVSESMSKSYPATPANSCRRMLYCAFLGWATLCVAGCERSQDMAAPEEQPIVEAEAPPAIVANLPDRFVYLKELERPLQLQLHDLAMQRYRLLRESLIAEAVAALEESENPEPLAKLRLEPPTSPRLEVEADESRVRPAGELPVTIVAFCNFQSPHCVRLQITLSEVLPLFPGVVRFGARDLPLPFHRQAGPAAEAAGCALEQGNYWRFHDALYSGSGPLDRDRLVRAARSALLYADAFESCLDSGRRADAVARDVVLAEDLGIADVPAVFVNGLYASPEVRASDLIWLIEQELARLGVSSPRERPAPRLSQEPFVLKGLLPSAHAGQGLALLAPSIAPDEFRVVGEGSALTPFVLVRRVTPFAVELLRDGEPEFIEFGEADGDSVIAAGSLPAEEGTPDVTPHRAVPVMLDRNEVLVRLSDRIGLAEVLDPVPLTAGGYHLLRITEVRPGSLYELLGLKEGDVVVGVNEQPVHEADNPLWRALETEDEVRVRVMRSGGMAHHYTYRFDD
jgi:protein-disulfide isomerase/type II secretory pathway component PulC